MNLKDANLNSTVVTTEVEIAFRLNGQLARFKFYCSNN